MSKVKILLLLQFIFFFSVPVLAQVDTAWLRRYNGTDNLADVANAVVVDKSGNVYVTGYSAGSETGPDYATIKYAPSGDTLWVRRYYRVGYYDDVATALAVDDSGNVYVTGSSGTIKYLPNGDSAWVKSYDVYGTSIAVDDFGYVYVTGSSGNDYATIKFAPDGDSLWLRKYNGPGSSVDIAYALALDKSGNVYVTGESFDNGASSDYATIKYAANGDTVWVRRYNGPGNYVDRANALEVDDNGYICVTGSGFGSGTYDDNATIKYTPEGDTLWVRYYNGPTDSIDYARDLAVDDSGNVYVTGGSFGTGNFPDYVTIKYAPNGDTVWVRRYDGPGNNYDGADALALDNMGNVCVTGWSVGLTSGIDYATILYAPTGDVIWVRRYNGTGNYSDYAWDLAIDDSGYVYVTGESKGAGTGSDYATIKYFPCLLKAGDVNASGGNPNLSDIIYLVNFLFKGGPAPPATCGGDPNGSGGSGDLTDVIYLVNFIFKAGPAPVKIAVCCL